MKTRKSPMKKLTCQKIVVCHRM